MEVKRSPIFRLGWPDGSYPDFWAVGYPKAAASKEQGALEAVGGETVSYIDQQIALRASRGLALLPGGIIQVSGQQRLDWLTTLSTQLLTDLLPGCSQEALLLDANGRIQHHFGVLADQNALWLLTSPQKAAGLAQFLESMRFMYRVEVDLIPNCTLLAWLTPGSSGDVEVKAGSGIPAGPAEAEEVESGLSAGNTDGEKQKIDRMKAVLTRLYGQMKSNSSSEIGKEAGRNPWGETLPVWDDPWPQVQPNGTGYTAKKVNHPGAEFRAHYGIVPSETAAELANKALDILGQELELPYLSADGYRVDTMQLCEAPAWKALQISSWRPGDTEVDSRTLPHEVDWLRTAVHLHKGCYCGQEAVARIVNLGRPPRRLVFLSLDGSPNFTPPKGAEIRLGPRRIGHLSAVGQHFSEGLIGLGLIKRNAQTDGRTVQVCWSESLGGQDSQTQAPGDGVTEQNAHSGQSVQAKRDMQAKQDAQLGQKVEVGQLDSAHFKSPVVPAGQREPDLQSQGTEVGKPAQSKRGEAVTHSSSEAGSGGMNPEAKREYAITAEIFEIVSPQGISWNGQSQIDRSKFQKLGTKSAGSQRSGLIIN